MPLRAGEVDLCALAEEAVGSLGHSRNASVTHRHPERPVLALVDPELIRRVIANLVGNALKFAPRDSEIRVEIARGSEGCEIKVSDSGPGIPAEDQARIFEKFGEAGGDGNGKPKLLRSSGLGLTFCKLAVEAHGGRIGVESAVGAGSTFWVRLPDRVPLSAAVK
jgi:signal transduction histidine kinase